MLYQEFPNIRNDVEALKDMDRQLSDHMENMKQCFEFEKQRIENEKQYLNSRLHEVAERLERIESTVDMHGVKLSGIIRTRQNAESVLQEKQSRRCKEKMCASEPGYVENSYDGIDYFDFENHFRGSRAHVKRSQEIYVKYFEGRNHVIDLGCGRGEFLELLIENGIQGYGVDLYQEFVDLCLQKQLPAVCGNVLEALQQEKETDGIFAGQLYRTFGFAAINKAY